MSSSSWSWVCCHVVVNNCALSLKRKFHNIRFTMVQRVLWTFLPGDSAALSRLSFSTCSDLSHTPITIYIEPWPGHSTAECAPRRYLPSPNLLEEQMSPATAWCRNHHDATQTSKQVHPTVLWMIVTYIDQIALNGCIELQCELDMAKYMAFCGCLSGNGLQRTQGSWSWTGPSKQGTLHRFVVAVP